jgi:putative ABC transport system ATP-binding protein
MTPSPAPASPAPPASPVAALPGGVSSAPLAPAPPPILEARNLVKRYPLRAEVVEAVRGVSLAVAHGELVALMGPSGSGKTTLLQLLGGLDRPSSGEVWVAGREISRLSDDEATRLRRERTGFVFQSFNLVPLLDVVENVGLPFTIAGQDPRRGELADRVRDAIAQVDLAGKERHRPEQLSAGEQQRVAIARAIVTRPALLFADEPTGNLDFRTGGDILHALWRTCVERGQTIVLVTHDAKAAAYADRVLVIGDGAIRDEIVLGRREDHAAAPLIARLAQLGL